jgi:glyoxylase-like metal-dependent hydrolase (beta-lactamase superfamily II)
VLLKVVVVGPLATNCYIVAGQQNSKAMIIDPGEDAPEIIDALEADGLKAVYIVTTHAHFDHIQAVREVKKATGAEIFGHPADGLPYADKELTDGMEFFLDGLTFKVIHTPGHSAGSCSLLTDGALFSGDLLFEGSVGRTDFPGGSYDALLDSLDKLRPLPEDTVVYPGHGPATTLKREIEFNPFFQPREK